MDRPQPETDHDLLISLWTFLVGTNGNGLIAKFEEFSTATDKRLGVIEAQLPRCWTRDDHVEAVKETAARDAVNQDRRKISTREWALVAVSVLGPIIAVIIAKVLA